MVKEFRAQPPDDMPEDTICVVLQVPNSPAWLGALWWVLNQYNYWYNWHRTDDKRGVLVAWRWRKMFWQAHTEYMNGKTCIDINNFDVGVNLGEDMSQSIRISPDDDCIIQMWCIDHWEDWYDPRSCIVGGVTQPVDGTALDIDECRTWDVNLRAGEQWLLPIPVSSGYTMQVTEASGGWSDGTLQWACPSGQAYFAGICGTPLPFDAGDPIPTLAHMRLIADIDGTFVDAYNRVLNIPSGTVDGQVLFQANDDPIEGNFGSVSFKVNVCNSSENVWSKTWDFSISDGGWEPILDSTTQQPLAVYNPGDGWDSVYQTAQDDTLTAIMNCFPSNANIIGINVLYNDTHVVANGAVLTLQGCISPPPFDFTANTVAANGVNFVWSGNINTSGLVVLIYSSFNGNIGSTRIVRVTVTGKGFNPFV